MKNEPNAPAPGFTCLLGVFVLLILFAIGYLAFAVWVQ